MAKRIDESKKQARRKQERDEAKQLYELVGKIISDRNDQIDISPTWIATECMRKLHGMSLRDDRPLIYIGCHLQLRQIARSICGKKWENDDDSTEQHEMFPGLQKRYPICRIAGEEPAYRRLEDMSSEDYDYNINRLRAEANEKQAHADRLEAHKIQIGVSAA